MGQKQADNGALNYRIYLEGDDEGMRRLIDEYYDSLALYLNTITGNMTCAEDATEKVFVRLAVNKPRFEGRSSFKTWLYAIGKNAARDYMRSLAVRGAGEKRAGMYASTEDVYIDAEEKRALYRAMEQLKPDLRQVIWLCYFEEMSYEETAQIIGKSKSAVCYMLTRAKEKLRVIMEKEGYKG